MKKKIMIIALFALSLPALTSCSKNKVANQAQNCNDLFDKVTAANLTYSLDPLNTANCRAYKTALTNLLGCSILSAGLRTEYQQSFDQLTCQ